MPEFHRMMGERLRSVEQGADTVVWLALSRAAGKTRSGQFFQGEQQCWLLCEIYFLYALQWIQVKPWQAFCVADRRPVSVHLPLAWTHSSEEDIQCFMNQLDALAKAVQSQLGSQPELNGPTDPSRTQTEWSVCYIFDALVTVWFKQLIDRLIRQLSPFLLVAISGWTALTIHLQLIQVRMTWIKFLVNICFMCLFNTRFLLVGVIFF